MVPIKYRTLSLVVANLNEKRNFYMDFNNLLHSVGLPKIEDQKTPIVLGSKLLNKISKLIILYQFHVYPILGIITDYDKVRKEHLFKEWHKVEARYVESHKPKLYLIQFKLNHHVKDTILRMVGGGSVHKVSNPRSYHTKLNMTEQKYRFETVASALPIWVKGNSAPITITNILRNATQVEAVRKFLDKHT